jgi:hypothetical protein
MPTGDVRSVHMPYCIKKQPDGRFLILNREYLPLGYTQHGQADINVFAVKIGGLTKRVAALLSHDGNPDTDCIYLYDSSCIPTMSTANMRAYTERLARLARLKIQPPRGFSRR